MILKLEWASESPEAYLKTHFPEFHPQSFDVESLGLGASEKFAFLTTSQVMLKLLVRRPLLRTAGPGKRQAQENMKKMQALTRDGGGGWVLNKVLRVEWTGNGDNGGSRDTGAGQPLRLASGLLVPGFCRPLKGCSPASGVRRRCQPAWTGHTCWNLSVQLSWQGFPVWSLFISVCVQREPIFFNVFLFFPGC